MIWIIIAAVSGSALALQSGCNTVLSRALGGPIAAALVSFCTGSLMLGLVFASPLVGPARPAMANLPWWAWCGGILGATFVAGSAAAAPRLGSANLVSVMLAAQLSAAVLLDHFALVGFPSRPITSSRAIGIMLLFVGVTLIRRG